MAEGIVCSILGKIGEYLVAPIGRQFGYLFCYNNNIKNLRDQTKNLEDVKDGVQLSVDAAKNNLEVIAPHVQSWLTNVEQIKAESDRIFEGKGFVDKGCLNGRCPNLKSRYLLSREASKKAQAIAELRTEGIPFTKPSYHAPPAGMATSTSTSGSIGFPARMSITKEITDALKNDNISMIGICGMGGIGKTTIVEEIAKRTTSEKNFDEFAIAVVSQNKDVIKIQGQLADMLGLEFQAQTSIFARAQHLRKRLANGKKILVILDDVWEALDMREIGIPIGDDCRGCKVALTSRIEDVCSRMGTQKNFTIEVLSEKEAWHLFKEKAGNTVDVDDVRPIAEKVAKECGGLPLALVVVAGALKGRKKHAWDDALQQLRKSMVTNITEMQKIVYSRIEWSYNFLESKQAKSLLMVCCLFQEDEKISIELLVRYWVGLELFKDLDTLADTRNRVYSLVDELRSSNLLLYEGDNIFVKMHDVIRDVGLSIASKDGHGYMVRHDTNLKEWPQKDKHLPHTAISLYSNQIQELPAGLDFPNLKLLRLVCGIKNLKISRDFFEGMKALKAITFEVEKSANSLPTSFKILSNLRTLCLENCGFVGDLSFIGDLQQLEILSFFNSNKVVLPCEVGKLSNLKLLDLRCEFVEGLIPYGVLSRLRNLKELYMGGYFFKYGNKENCASVTELNSLSLLKRLQISIPKGNKFLLKLKDFNFVNLTEYAFSMDSLDKHAWRMYDSPQYQLGENSLSFCGVDKIVILDNNINVLLRRTKCLDLKEVRGLKNVVKDLDEEEGFVRLETLEIESCNELEYVMDAEICHGNHLLEMSIERHSRRGPTRLPPLGNLKVLYLNKCKAIKSLFEKSVAKCLVQLQELEVWSCDLIEGIFLSEENNETQDKVMLPKLNFLCLDGLPSFRSFVHADQQEDNIGSENIDDGGTRQSIFNQQVLLPNMETLSIWAMKKHVLLAADEMRDGSLFNQKRIGVRHCADMEAIFDFEMLKFGREEEHAQLVMLGQLESVEISIMSKLTHIWRMVPRGIQGFHNLQNLEVHYCQKLRYLLSPLVAKMLVNLQHLSLDNCPKIEQVIRIEEDEEEEDISEIKMMDKIVFPLLEEVCIIDCPNMKTFCSGQLITPKLERVYISIGRDESIWKGDLNSTVAFLSERHEDPQDSSDSQDGSE